MIIVRTSGGLGNQLFQYGFARAIAERTSERVYIDTLAYHPLLQGKVTPREFTLNHFNITITKTSAFQNIFRKLATSVFKNMKIVRDSTPFVFNQKAYDQTIKAYFAGVWSNFKYVTPIRSILLKEFSLKEHMGAAGTQILSQEESSTSVSIHIRRGDYLQHQHKHVILANEYYVEAVRIMREKLTNPSFFIFSDDIAYVKENYNELFGDDAVYVSGLQIPDFEELILMSRCKHNIVANSSFSLWGAWLNQNVNPIVIAPKKYRVDKTDDSDFVPSGLGWIQI